MKISEAITKADKLRDNALDSDTKAAWLRTLDGQIAENIGFSSDGESPVWPLEMVWPIEDAELLMPFPHDDVYTLYLVAMIDYYNGESDLYANDMAVFNTAMADARAWWQRTHRPPTHGIFKAW